MVQVDDGLPLRKAALTCCETILYVAPDFMDSSGLMAQLVAMVADNKEDTNLQCHQVCLYLRVCYQRTLSSLSLHFCMASHMTLNAGDLQVE